MTYQVILKYSFVILCNGYYSLQIVRIYKKVDIEISKNIESLVSDFNELLRIF